MLTEREWEGGTGERVNEGGGVGGLDLGRTQDACVNPQDVATDPVNAVST